MQYINHACTYYIAVDVVSRYTDTENELATHQGGYDNISVTHLPANPTLDFLKFLNEIKPGDVSADCILAPI